MYLHHELREVTQYRQTEALQRISQLHHLMAESSGFIRSLACRYLGNTTQYAWLRMWQSATDHAAFRQTRPAIDFGATRPEGLYGPLPGGIAPAAHWQSVLENGDQDAGGSYLYRIAFSVAADATDEFLSHRQQQDDLALDSSGITSAITFEEDAQGSENAYLTLIRARDPKSYREFLERPAYQIHREGLKEGTYQTLVTECYEIVEELERGQ